MLLTNHLKDFILSRAIQEFRDKHDHYFPNVKGSMEPLVAYVVNYLTNKYKDHPDSETTSISLLDFLNPRGHLCLYELDEPIRVSKNSKDYRLQAVMRDPAGKLEPRFVTPMFDFSLIYQDDEVIKAQQGYEDNYHIVEDYRKKQTEYWAMRDQYQMQLEQYLTSSVDTDALIQQAPSLGKYVDEYTTRSNS